MSGRKHKEIKVSRLLKAKNINLNLEARDKKSLLLELIAFTAKSGKLRNKKLLHKAIQEREKLGSTGIGNGVAIPHAKSEAVSHFVLTLGRKNEGIDFGALDGEKTYLFFMLASPQDDVGKHLKILSEISYLVKDKFVVELLKRATNKKEVLSIISHRETPL